MHCWKMINMQKQYGHDRIFLFSILFVFAVFSCFYILINTIYHGPVSDNLFSIFIVSLVLIYPLHKLFHFLPIVLHRQHLRFSIQKKLGFIPTLNMKIHEPILKAKYIFSLCTPFILINGGLIIGAILFPSFRHYFAILLAYHCGLCLVDLLYIKHLIKTPKEALIEETDKGFEILIPNR